MSLLLQSSLSPMLRAIVEDRHDFDLGGFDDDMVRKAIDVGLGPALYRATRRGFRSDWQNTLRAQDLAARVESLVRLDALEEILANSPQELSGHVLLLKGISLCQRIYPEAHLRMMGDVDLLVPRELQSSLENVLRELGYVQQSAQSSEFYVLHHHSMPFVHPRQNIVVEVHTGLFRTGTRLASAELFKPESILGHCAMDEFRGYRINRLEAETELAYLAAHWIEERRCFGTAMIPILDLALLLSQLPENFGWSRLLNSLSDSPAAPYVRVALSFLHDRVGIRLPDDVRQQLDELKSPPGAIVDQWLHLMIDRHVIQGRPFGSFLTATMADAAWDTLMRPYPGWMNFLSLPWCLMFPSEYPQRFNPAFQIRRIKSAFRRRKNHGTDTSD